MTARASRPAEKGWRGEPSPQRLADGCRDLVGRHARRRDVGDRPRRRREPDAVAADDIGLGQRVRRGMDPHARLRHKPPPLPWDRQVDPVGDHIGQAEELEGRLMGDDGVGRLAQPGGDDLLIRRRG